MQLEEKQVTLRKLTAGEGKIIVSKLLNEDGEPRIRAKEIYLANNDSEDNFMEIEES